VAVVILHVHKYEKKKVTGKFKSGGLHERHVASYEIFWSSNKIYREVGRAKDLSAPQYCFIGRTVHSKKRLLGRQDVLLAMFVVNGLSPTRFLHFVYLTLSVYVLSNCTTRLRRIKQNFSPVFHGKVDLPESSQF